MNDWAAAGPAGSHMEDKELIARFLTGEASAFERLFRKYQHPLFSVCRQFFDNIEDAEDVVQDAFLQIYQGLPRFKGRSTFFTWAYSVTVHACLAKARRRNRRRIDADAMNAHIQVADPVRQQMRDAVMALPDRFRMVIILQYYQELSHEEIAQVLGWTIGQVKINLHRARFKLRESLGQQDCVATVQPDVAVQTHECGGAV